MRKAGKPSTHGVDDSWMETSGWTAWGWMRVWASERGVVRVEWPEEKPPLPAGKRCRQYSPPQAGESVERGVNWAEVALHEIEEYLEGRRRVFTVPVDDTGLSSFARGVIRGCRRVDYGQTISYGELAARIGQPGAARAVGQVMARNPVPLIVPCHRVVAAGGGLGGFGGGLDRKRELLDLEAAHAR